MLMSACSYLCAAGKFAHQPCGSTVKATTSAAKTASGKSSHKRKTPATKSSAKEPPKTSHKRKTPTAKENIKSSHKRSASAPVKVAKTPGK